MTMKPFRSPLAATASPSPSPPVDCKKRPAESMGTTATKFTKLATDDKLQRVRLSGALPTLKLHSNAALKQPHTGLASKNSSEVTEQCFSVLCIAKGIKSTAGDLKDGDEFSLGGKDIEVVSSLDLQTYRSGRCFIAVPPAGSSSSSANLTRSTSAAKFKTHNVVNSQGNQGHAAPRPRPRHNPEAPCAIVLPRPPSTHPRVIKGYGAKRPPGDIGLVDVVVDPVLTQQLRPHQKEGVRFLYECVMQMKDINGQGAILADEMGLGKTLQTIALLWTLLKQSPYFGEESSVVKRALVVCPASLITNWQKEFKKWLGVERLRVFAVDSKSTMTDFTLGRVYPVMIIGYEKLRLAKNELKNANFDIIICDEGHRLKTSNIKTAQAIRSLPAKRRIILSGTPIQNDLGEFFSMIDFVNPGIFESYSSFKRVFEDPIVKSRQPDCSAVEAALGLERSQELARLTSQFILRRTAQVNYEFLPRKSEMVVFCQLSSLQQAIYRHLLNSSYLQSCFSMDGSRHLVCIAALRKLCNSPQLALEQAELKDDPAVNGLYNGVKELIQSTDVDIESSFISGTSQLQELCELVTLSKQFGNGQCFIGKLRFVDTLLQSIKRDTTERVVLVSNFTQTLDLLESLCKKHQYAFFRLDGSVIKHITARTNPSTDLQAMARIHRDGQVKPVYIYRLLSYAFYSGTIEEKMYQRQLTKVGLSDALMDGKTTEKLNKFSTAELRDLFTLHEDEPCVTHMLLGCGCSAVSQQGINSARMIKPSKGSILDETSALRAKKELEEWTHIDVEAWRRSTTARRGKGNDEDSYEYEGLLDKRVDELASKDKVLWSAIASSGETGAEDEEQEQENADDTSVDRDTQHDGTVVFVFLKSDSHPL
ncbi:DNA repair and recombination protein rad54b [Mortierella claussenii]|nr:DNA repair and recombination protein rad54b [Mortierella claussenii]